MSSKTKTTAMKDEAMLAFVPKLRFPEFRGTEAWDADALGDVATFVNERIALERVPVENYVSTENILPDYGGIAKASRLPATGSVTRYRPNDTLVSNIRPYLKKVWVADKEGGASNDIIVIRAKERLLPQYLSCLLKRDVFIDYVMTSAKGVKMPRGDVASMKAYPTFYPSKAEQQHIFECLNSADQLIAAQARKVEALKTRKIGLTEQLFPREGENQPHLRFPEFQDAGDWKDAPLETLLVVRNEKQPPAADMPLYSLTIEDGVTPKAARYDREFLVRDADNKKYKVVRPEDIVYNPSNLRWGAINFSRLQHAVVVSPIYEVLYVKDRSQTCLNFIAQAVMRDEQIRRFITKGQGTLIERVAVKIKDFLETGLQTPSIPEEQQRIAAFLSSLDAGIIVETQKLAALKSHKKGLMQQLFPSPDEAEA